MTTDPKLKADIERELARDPRIDAAAIGVAVHHGVVTLTGTVPTWTEKHAAEDTTYRVAGVRYLANDIAIRPSWCPARSDADIAEAVRDAFARDRLVPYGRLRSTVSDAGTVTLMGTVHSLAQRNRAERVARAVDGVRTVIDQIAIEPRAPSSEAVTRRIRREHAR